MNALPPQSGYFFVLLFSPVYSIIPFNTRLAAFSDIVQQDPVISQVKLIAEPWDIGEGGYQVGKFPPLWSEWNGKYRDCVRDFWRGEDQEMEEEEEHWGEGFRQIHYRFSER